VRFESRELKPYAEPVLATDLEVGSVYFLLTFADDDMHIPILQTLVFVGRTSDGIVRFQDVETYRAGVRFDNVRDEDHAVFFECSGDQLNCIFEFEQALDLLLGCSLRRRNVSQ